jgi:hypothetical protein
VAVKLDELEQSLPHGFHDSIILAFSVDVVGLKLAVELEVAVDAEEVRGSRCSYLYRRGTLTFSGLLSFAYESPENPPRLMSGQRIDIDTGPVSEVRQQRAWFPKTLPEEAFTTYIYLDFWESFIILAATDAQLQWSAGPEGNPAGRRLDELGYWDPL